MKYYVYVTVGDYPSFPSFLGSLEYSEITGSLVKELWIRAQVESCPEDKPDVEQTTKHFEENIRLIAIPVDSGPVNLSILTDYNSAGPIGCKRAMFKFNVFKESTLVWTL